jgi:hypothetical protein
MRNHLATRLIILGTIALALLGCRHTRFEIDKLPAGNYGRYIVGETSYARILDAIGPPRRIVKTGAGFAFFYEAMESDEYILTASYSQAKASISTGDIIAKRVSLFFNEEGKYLYSDVVTRKLHMGWGGLVGHNYMDSLFFETRDYPEFQRPQNRWGALFLDEEKIYPSVPLRRDQP